MSEIAQAPEVQEFRVFKVLGKSFSVMFRNIVRFGALVIATFALGWLVGLAPLAIGNIFLGIVFDIVSFVISIFISCLVAAALFYGTFQDLSGNRVSIVECLRLGSRRALPLLPVFVLGYIAMMVGFLVLIIPMFIIIVMFWVAGPVAVLERPGVFASFRRSVALTKGYRWRIFGMFVVISLGSMTIGGAVLGSILSTFAAMDLETLAVTDPRKLLFMPGLAVPMLLTFTLSILSYIFLWVNLAVTYYALRLVKDGLGADEVSAVFG